MNITQHDTKEKPLQLNHSLISYEERRSIFSLQEYYLVLTDANNIQTSKIVNYQAKILLNLMLGILSSMLEC